LQLCKPPSFLEPEESYRNGGCCNGLFSQGPTVIRLDGFVMTTAPPKNSGLTAFKQFGRLLRRS
jgi:hypothetical protein